MESLVCRNCGQPVAKAGGKFGVYCHVALGVTYNGPYGAVECQGASPKVGPFAEPAPLSA